MSDISSNASTLSEESTNTLLQTGAIVSRALNMLGDESVSNRISNSSGILSGSDSQVERLTELLNRTKVNSTHSCLQCLDVITIVIYLKYFVSFPDLKYNHVIRNGQRIYGSPPPKWQGDPPVKGSEVFVGKLPHGIFEDELVPIFEQVFYIKYYDLFLEEIKVLSILTFVKF